ncbi:MAG TPA: SpoIIE family protein phosphatase [Thermoleophilaceae bacterium]
MGEEGLIEAAVAEAAMPGEDESGDLHLIAPHPGGVLVAAIDGLGHGGEAAEAARTARSTLARDPGADLTDLLVSAHTALARSRGVVISLVAFVPGGSLTWLGVGNVEGTLVRADERPVRRADSILLLGGVVGFQLPRLRPSTTAVQPGDLLILATDGIAAGYVPELDPDGDPKALADRILAQYRKGGDDALVLVARYLG